MRIPVFIVLVLLFSISSSVYGQGKIKPSFNSLEFASYERNNQNKPEVNFYINIDSSGKIAIVDKHGTKESYYSYTLSDSIIQELNTVFNGKKPIKSYRLINTLEPDAHYAGDYSFVAFRGRSKKTEYLTYIPPFMDYWFFNAYRTIIETFIPSNSQVNQAIPIRKAFLNELWKHDKKAILPKKELPPPEVPAESRN